MAQVSGKLVDKDTKRGIGLQVVQLGNDYAPTDAKGNFKFMDPKLPAKLVVKSPLYSPYERMINIPMDGVMVELRVARAF